MARLFNFDYKSPFFYMVTLKRLPGISDFSVIGEDGRLVRNAITDAFDRTISTFHRRWRCIEEISPFVVMPDHIHLMIKIRATPDRVALGVIVSQLAKALRGEYWRVVAADAATRNTLGIAPGIAHTDRAVQGNAPGVAPAASAAGRSAPRDIFEKEWHDWIVKRDGQLATFRRYIRENPMRAAMRRKNAHFFGSARRVSFLGCEWFAYGNTEILRLPGLVPIKGHRTTPPGSPEWNALLATASRIGPGGAGVSTFMSPLEKACGNAIAKAGGKWIVLSPEGFSPRWHPPREKERFCAQGRMLFLSLYEASTRKPTRKMLYERCHEMIDLVIATLS
ncbi:MAG: hypothetical protein IKO72_07315 [Kiritimatiellae bacterium]|nr:hypothetical protein [Kiritimatiellia bacterium]